MTTQLVYDPVITSAVGVACFYLGVGSAALFWLLRSRHDARAGQPGPPAEPAPADLPDDLQAAIDVAAERYAASVGRPGAAPLVGRFLRHAAQRAPLSDNAQSNSVGRYR